MFYKGKIINAVGNDKINLKKENDSVKEIPISNINPIKMFTISHSMEPKNSLSTINMAQSAAINRKCWYLLLTKNRV